MTAPLRRAGPPSASGLEIAPRNKGLTEKRCRSNDREHCFPAAAEGMSLESGSNMDNLNERAEGGLIRAVAGCVRLSERPTSATTNPQVWSGTNTLAASRAVLLRRLDLESGGRLYSVPSLGEDADDGRSQPRSFRHQRVEHDAAVAPPG